MKKIEEKKVTKDTKKVSKKVAKDNKKKESLFKQIKKEMQKVHFPSRKDMIKYSIATIAFVVFFAVYFYAIELVMAFIKSLI
ncbi:MAG: preprotein translocase subunit SecE [Bacilli bacterium]|nr:preprotein translocase subunit SecE [Bacilli bacterium]